MPNFSDKFQEFVHYKKQQRKQNTKIVAFSAISAFFGAAVALLFSPGSGKQNRQYISSQANKAGNNLRELEGRAEEKVRSAKKELEEKFNELKSKIESKTDTAKQKAAKTITKK